MKTISLFNIFKRDSLFSRSSGKELKRILDEELGNSNAITLDFSGINWISIGWADEVIGSYAKTKGIKFIKENIKLINIKDHVKQKLNYVAKERKKENKHGQENA